jgi:hypothetical protein
MKETCKEQICAPPDMFQYEVRAEIPLLIDWDGEEEIPLILSTEEYILI